MSIGRPKPAATRVVGIALENVQVPRPCAVQGAVRHRQQLEFDPFRDAKPVQFQKGVGDMTACGIVDRFGVKRQKTPENWVGTEAFTA